MNSNEIKYLKYIKLGCLTTVFLVSIACSKQETEIQAKPSGKSTVSYETVNVKEMNPDFTVSVPGELKPYESAQLFAKVQGFIKKIYVDRGSMVKKGQLLAVLEAPEMNQDYLADKSSQQKMYTDFLYNKQAYERLLDAAKTKGAVADIELDRAKSLMESSRSAYESSKAGAGRSSQMNEYLRITAPFNGVITERNLSAGALTGPNTGIPIFKIAQKEKLRLTVSVPEKYVSSLSKSTKVNFTVNSIPGQSFTANLSRDSHLIDAENRALTVEFDVENNPLLKGGEYAQVKLHLKRNASTLFVPQKSIVQSQQGVFVMSINNNEIKKIPVKEGITSENMTEVFGDLTVNDKILKKPSEEIKEGKIN